MYRLFDMHGPDRVDLEIPVILRVVRSGLRLTLFISLFFFQAEDGIRDYKVTGVQTCALPISTESTRGGSPCSPNCWATRGRTPRPGGAGLPGVLPGGGAARRKARRFGEDISEIGRASCRERV